MASLVSEQAFIDHTLISFYGNEDLQKLSWSQELSKALQLKIDKFPKIVSPFSIIGNLSKDASGLCNLPSGIPIYAGAGDQPASLLGSGMTEAGYTLEVSGSTTLLFTSVDKFIPDFSGQTMYMPSVFQNTLYAFNYINGAGIDITWFRDMFSSTDTKETFFSTITNKARTLPPGSNGLLFSPYFGGRQCPYNADLRGSWIGLNWRHGKEHLYRSMLESIAYSFSIGLSRITELFDYHPRHIYSCGGGSENSLWNQIKADVLNLKLQPVSSYNNSLIGTGIIALHGLGALEDPKKIKLSFDPQKPFFIPNKEVSGIYKQYCSLFKEMHTTSLEDTYKCIQQIISKEN